MYKIVALACLTFCLILIAVFAVYLSQRGTSEALSDTYLPNIRVGGASLKVYVADTSEERARGLSGTTALPPGQGFLLIFDNDDTHGFWMKGMQFPIDIIWADSNGVVVHVEKALAPETYPRIFMPPTRARYVIETGAGFVERHGILVGDFIEL